VLGIALAQLLSPAANGEAAAPHAATLYLNFTGADLTPGNHAARDEAPCIEQPLQFPAFSGSLQSASAVTQVIGALLEPFAVDVVSDARPPAHLPYAMVLIGGSAEDFGLASGVLGLACTVDCGDSWWRDVTYAFANDAPDDNALANIALQEAAHAWGLDHVSGADLVMSPVYSPGPKRWEQECVPNVTTSGSVQCPEWHERFCSPGEQNSNAELMATFGPRSPDVVPPTIVILAPEHDAALEPGPVDVEVAIQDDRGAPGWLLSVDELGVEVVAPDDSTELRVDLPAGEWEIRVEAIDHARNRGSDSVHVVVGDEGSPPDGSCTTHRRAPGSLVLASVTALVLVGRRRH
jgi:hypothetical protein